MMRLLANWLVSAVALIVVAHIAPGFYVADFGAALVAALVIGLINATLGLFLKIVTAPLTILTLGGFLLVVNALMLMLASSLVRGFHVRGFGAAFIGGIVLALVNLGLRWLIRSAASPPPRSP
jgi:putative membrane protein